MKNYIKFLSVPLACTAIQPIMAENSQPNIILILTDDLGYGDLSTYNPGSKIQTTNLDRMASEGVCFTDAHSSSAVSTPSRYSLLTGRYNWRSTLKEGVLFGYDKPFIKPGRKTIADVLKRGGYTTACIGKWHLGWVWNNIDKGKENIDFTQPITEGPTERGFDYFYGIIGSLDMDPYVYVENNMPTAVPNRTTGNTGLAFWRKGPTASDFDHEDCLPNFVRRAQNYITEHAQANQPFFLYLPMPAPHTPILPVKEFQGKSGIGAYGDFVLMVDHLVGEIMQTVKQAGIDENTIIIFTSDNGCSPAADIKSMKQQGHLPNYVYRGNKADLFDGGHRIPCIARWPKGITPHRENQTICLTDWMATLAAITHVSLNDSEGEDSYSLLPLLKETNYATPIREAIVHHSINGEFSIRKDDWKLLLSASSGGWSYPTPEDKEALKGLPPVQLYNMGNDPCEQKNLEAQYPEKVKELRDLLIKYINDGRSTPGKPQPNDNGNEWKQIKDFPVIP